MSDTENGKSPFNGWWVASAVLLVAVLVALGVILWPRDDNGAQAEKTPSLDAPSSSEGAESPSMDECDALAPDDSIPTDGPSAEWTNKSYFITPQSDEYGPATGDNPLWGCYSHSPTGALFASANFIGGLLDASTDPESFSAFAEAASVDNDGADQWIKENGDDVSPPSPGRVPQLAGFRFESVEGDAVTVRLGVSQGDVSAYWELSLEWVQSESTWKVDLRNLSLSPVADELTTFTPWTASDVN